jgi:hypothetical protein
MSGYAYTAYGLTISVPFACPGLPRAIGDSRPDVIVQAGVVPRRLKHPVLSDERWDVEPGTFLVRGGRRAGRFLVESGTVTVDRNPEGTDQLLGECFVREVLPAILRDRGLLVLHANAAITPRGVVLVAGESGVGKSTTLAALLEHGCMMLADDVTTVALAADGYPDVLPGVATMRLTEAAVNGLGYQLVPELEPRRRRLKSWIPTDDRMAHASGRLVAIHILAIHDGEGVRATELSGVEKFSALQSCVHGPMLAHEHPQVFPVTRAIVRSTAIYLLERPAVGWTVEEVAGGVLASPHLAAP